MKLLLKMMAVVAMILLFVVGWIVTDVIRNNKIKRVKARPEEKLSSKSNEILFALQKDQPVNWNDMDDTYKYVNGRYDCADFRLQSLMRILYDHHEKIDPEAKEKLKQTNCLLPSRNRLTPRCTMQFPGGMKFAEVSFEWHYNNSQLLLLNPLAAANVEFHQRPIFRCRASMA